MINSSPLFLLMFKIVFLVMLLLLGVVVVISMLMLMVVRVVMAIILMMAIMPCVFSWRSVDCDDDESFHTALGV